MQWYAGSSQTGKYALGEKASFAPPPAFSSDIHTVVDMHASVLWSMTNAFWYFDFLSGVPLPPWGQGHGMYRVFLFSGGTENRRFGPLDQAAAGPHHHDLLEDVVKAAREGPDVLECGVVRCCRYWVFLRTPVSPSQCTSWWMYMFTSCELIKYFFFM
jgi:hypothetical protein